MSCESKLLYKWDSFGCMIRFVQDNRNDNLVYFVKLNHLLEFAFVHSTWPAYLLLVSSLSLCLLLPLVKCMAIFCFTSLHKKVISLATKLEGSLGSWERSTGKHDILQSNYCFMCFCLLDLRVESLEFPMVSAKKAGEVPQSAGSSGKFL